METTMTTINALDVAKGIAKELGEGWTAKGHALNEHTETFCQLIGPNQIDISVDMRPGATAKGRLELRGVIPTRDSKGKYRDHGIKAPKITVDPIRPAKAIAADMYRRFFPLYFEAYTAATKYITECNEDLAKVESLLDQLHEVVEGDSRDRLSDYDREQNQFTLSGENYYGSVRASAGADHESVTIELRSLPSNVAIEVLRLVRSLDGKKGE